VPTLTENCRSDAFSGIQNGAGLRGNGIRLVADWQVTLPSGQRICIMYAWQRSESEKNSMAALKCLWAFQSRVHERIFP